MLRVWKILFCGCSLLISLPNISKWNTINVKYMTKMFEGCLSLPYIPNITIFLSTTISNKNNIFNDCLTAINLPDISSLSINQRRKRMMFNFLKKKYE